MDAFVPMRQRLESSAHFRFGRDRLQPVGKHRRRLMPEFRAKEGIRPEARDTRRGVKARVRCADDLIAQLPTSARLAGAVWLLLRDDR
jgi:hypothetical protein